MFSLFAASADAYSQSFCECFGVANVEITSFSNCFEQLSLARQSANSVSSLAGVRLFKHFKSRLWRKTYLYDSRLAC